MRACTPTSAPCFYVASLTRGFVLFLRPIDAAAANGTSLSAAVTAPSTTVRTNAESTDSPRVSAWSETAPDGSTHDPSEGMSSHRAVDRDVVMAAADDDADDADDADDDDADDDVRGGRADVLGNDDDDDVEFPPEDEPEDVAAVKASHAPTPLRTLQLNTADAGNGGLLLSSSGSARSPKTKGLAPPLHRVLVAPTSGESSLGRRIERKRRSFHDGDDDDDDDD
jgi:hypothetical protein